MKLNLPKLINLCNFRETKYLFSLVLIFVGLSRLFLIVTPIILGKLVDILQSNGSFSFVITTTPITLTLVYGFCWLLSKLLQSIQSFVFSFLYQRLYTRIIESSVLHIHNLAYDFFAKNNSGNISQKIRFGIRGFDVLLSSMLFVFIPTFIELCFIFTVFVYYAYKPLYLLYLAISIVLYYVITLYLTQKRLKSVKEVNDSEIRLFTMLSDNLTNFEAVKLNNRIKFLSNEYRSNLDNYKTKFINVSLQMFASKMVQDLILGITLVAFFIATIFQFETGRISVGQLVMFLNFLILLFTPIEALAVEQGIIQTSLVDMEEFFKLLDQKLEHEDKQAADLKVTKGSIVFDSVNFAYDKTHTCINNLSFTIRSKAMIALVGYSGSGKSTIARLILRLYDCDSGNILIDGQNIRNHTIASLRENIGYVPQDIILFNNTIRFNIAYSSDIAVSDEQIYEAARLAQVHDSIIKMPNGYDTIVGERGMNLSGGEKQRIALARVLVKNPKILIFDEITSSLDAYIRTKIDITIRNLRNKYTVIIISHNYSFMHELDEIIAISEGHLIGIGKHYELLLNNEYYKKLYGVSSDNT